MSLGQIIKGAIFGFCLSGGTAVAMEASLLSAELRNDPDIHNLLISVSARERLQAEYDALSAEGRLSQGEAADFKIYLGDMDQRIGEQCLNLLAERPELQQENLPCPQRLPAKASSVVVPPSELPEDAVAALEQELAEGLGDFDEMLLHEQEKIAAKAERAGEAGGGGGYEGEGAGEQSGEAEGGSESAQGSSGRNAERGEGQSGRPPRQTGTGSSGTEQKGGPPRQAGNRASDDDIVARQLREAAEKETDPELKKKLWEEYRRYKEGT